jgi:hypothetical protein
VLLGGFEFHDHGSLDKNVGEILTDKDAIIINGHLLLLVGLNTVLSQLMSQGILMDFLEETCPEFVCRRECTSDDQFGKLIQFPIAQSPDPLLLRLNHSYSTSFT